MNGCRKCTGQNSSSLHGKNSYKAGAEGLRSSIREKVFMKIPQCKSYFLGRLHAVSSRTGI